MSEHGRDKEAISVERQLRERCEEEEWGEEDLNERAVLESRYDEEGFYAGWEPSAGFQNARSERNIHEGRQLSAGSQSLRRVKRTPT